MKRWTLVFLLTGFFFSLTLAQDYGRKPPLQDREFPGSFGRKATCLISGWNTCNALGQQVAALLDEPKPAGYHRVAFEGREFSSGIYFYRLSTPEFQQARKMLLVR
jgi:hypothetical protein